MLKSEVQNNYGLHEVNVLCSSGNICWLFQSDRVCRVIVQVSPERTVVCLSCNDFLLRVYNLTWSYGEKCCQGQNVIHNKTLPAGAGAEREGVLV